MYVVYTKLGVDEKGRVVHIHNDYRQLWMNRLLQILYMVLEEVEVEGVEPAVLYTEYLTRDKLKETTVQFAPKLLLAPKISLLILC